MFTRQSILIIFLFLLTFIKVDAQCGYNPYNALFGSLIPFAPGPAQRYLAPVYPAGVILKNHYRNHHGSFGSKRDFAYSQGFVPVDVTETFVNPANPGDVPRLPTDSIYNQYFTSSLGNNNYVQIEGQNSLESKDSSYEDAYVNKYAVQNAE